jgi:membrane protease YdiL (CAAX protease family)
MRSFIHRYPLTSYFTLAFFISWGGILALVLPGSIPAPPDVAERLFPSVYFAMLAGPTLAALSLTFVIGGARGLREFGVPLLKWKVDARWYAVALLTAPLALMATMFALRAVSTDVVPGFPGAASTDPAGPIHVGSRVSFLFLGLSVGLGAGVFEELGWTGFALPRLLPRYQVVRAGLIAGVFWGMWHFVAVLWGSADAFGSVPIPLYLLVALFSALVPYRVLMTMVYARTGSMLVAMLMHASLTSSMLILGPQVTGSTLLAYDLAFGGVLWVVVLASRVSGLMQPRKRSFAGVPDTRPT